jgi:hypothetical protein
VFIDNIQNLPFPYVVLTKRSKKYYGIITRSIPRREESLRGSVFVMFLCRHDFDAFDGLVTLLDILSIETYTSKHSHVLLE